MSRVLPYDAKQWEVQAILAGTKTVTRLLIKPLPPEGYIYAGVFSDRTRKEQSKNIGKVAFTDLDYRDSHFYKIPYQVGDILWVRETWQLDPTGFEEFPPEYWWKYKASHDLPSSCTKWRPSIHMPKKAARIWLKVTDVRVERLQDITEEQAIAEGTPYKLCGGWHPTFNDPDSGGPGPDFILGFSKLWDSTIHKKQKETQGWDASPWVWVIEFERCERPEPCKINGKSDMAEFDNDGGCLGYSGEYDDEPCEMCKQCRRCTGNG